MAEAISTGKKWRTILTLVLSALGILFFIFQTLAVGAFWLISLLDAQQSMTESLSMGLLLWSSILSGLLLLPVFLLSINHFRGKDPPEWLDTGQPVFAKIIKWLIIVWPSIVLLGWLIVDRPSMAAFLLGPINILVAGIPVLWIYRAGQSKLNGGSQIRKWRIFGFSLTIMPVVVIIVELVAILILGTMGFLWLVYRFSVNPQFEMEVMTIVDQVVIAGDDLNMIIQLLKPTLLQPSVIVWVLAIFAGIIPLIEEILKPLALWALAGREISSQEGFVGGLLCGAGFALMENILYFTTIVLAEDWLFMAIGRAGTGVLHMLASGLVGWGLANAWRDGKWKFLAVTTFCAILLHGLWNAIALGSGILSIFTFGQEITLFQTIIFNLPMIFMLIFSALSMFLINRYLRRKDNHRTDSILETIPDGKNT